MKSKVPEKDENDVLKQINKHHKGTKEKLKKKRKQEKEIKKKKKEKKKEMEQKKLKKKLKKEKKKLKEEESDDEHIDSEETREEKILKYLKKLRIFMEEEADDLFEMFESIDNGGEVDIEELENTKVKNYLKKVFKYLGLRKNPETKEYSKDPEIHTEPIKPKITDLWYRGVDSSSSESEGEDNNKNKQMEEEKDFEEEEIANEIDMEKAKKALMEGIESLPEAKEPEKELEPEPQEEPKRIQGEEWRSFLDEKFGAMVGEDQKGYSKLGKRAGAPGEERSEKDKKIDEYMQNFNSQFRRKSLLEEHQERKRVQAMNAPKERRAFDRDLDVNMSRIDSKKVFQMLNNKDTNLTSRFGHSQSGNKYL